MLFPSVRSKIQWFRAVRVVADKEAYINYIINIIQSGSNL